MSLRRPKDPPMIYTDRERWLAKLGKLRVDVARGDPAPHKPLLLLVVMDLAEQQRLTEKNLLLTPELAFGFSTYWQIVAYRRTQPPDVRYPFFHLHRDGCWTPMDEERKPATDRLLARSAELNPGFEACLRDPAFREEARRVLICRYFPRSEWPGLCTLLGIPEPTGEEVVAASSHQSPEEANQKGREARFRLQVVPAYQYTCALTGYRIMTVASSSVIDAAHIHQFADSRNNDVRNGLALCKNAHWLFDNGLWTIDDDFSILVARDHFTEESPDQKALVEYEGQPIRLPSNPAFHPAPAYLSWHRRKKFRGSG
jgi:putative restriction endonuclease